MNNFDLGTVVFFILGGIVSAILIEIIKAAIL